MPVEPELPPVVDAIEVENIKEAQNQAIENICEKDDKAHDDIEMASNIMDPDNGDDVPNNSQLICWGKHGKTVLWIGIAIMWTVFEMDHTVLYNYQNYAASDFGQISSLGALQTAGTIIVAAMKPPIAKISDVIGRVETYCIVVLLYVISYILCATSSNFDQYAGGYVIYCIGATGMQIINQIIVADITTSRWRGLANGLINLPFMIIPWISAFIVENALKTIGWRWGIGMFAIIMPTVSSSIVGPLLYFRHRSKKAGYAARRSVSIKNFFIEIDTIGITLLASGCAMLLLPMALAGNVEGGWSNAWIPAVMVIGFVFLTCFTFYEARYATNPVMPACYFRNVSLVLACSIGLLDAFAFQITHTYMYAWSTVVHNFSAQNATFLTYTSGCFQVFAGLITGYLMYRSRRYKWLLIIGASIRLIGYGIMMRLRGSNNSTAELFIVQAIQGLGSGVVGSVVLVVAQVIVSRPELAQSTALILLAIFMGQAIGSAVAGAIYTNLFKSRLRANLGTSVSQSTIDNVFNSITSNLPLIGTPERSAIDNGYSDILRYMTIAALIASAFPMLMVWFLPNRQLNDKHNLTEENDNQSEQTGAQDSPSRVVTPSGNENEKNEKNEKNETETRSRPRTDSQATTLHKFTMICSRKDHKDSSASTITSTA